MKNNLTIEWLKQNSELYLNVFRGRVDVVANRWEFTDSGGKTRKGYSFLCANRNKQSVCPKVKDRKFPCGKCEYPSYIPMDHGLLRQHFDGKSHLGVYPLAVDETCWFVAGDFDNHSPETIQRNPFEDALKVCQAAEKHGLTAYAISSRSGAGCHVYIFFEAAIPALKARAVFESLLLEAGVDLGTGRDNSFDRIFPTQPKHCGVGLGNLIGMPFQGKCLENGYTQFIELPTAKPYDEQKQIEILENIARVSEKQSDELVKYFESKRPAQEHAPNSGRLPSPAKTPKSFSLPEQIATGQRNDTLFRLASSLLGKGLSNEAIARAVEAENQLKCNPPLPEDEVERIVESVVSRYESGNSPGTSNGFALTDLGNAERFRSRHAGRVVYNFTTKQWYIWDGMRFQGDEKSQVTQLAGKTVRSISAEAKYCNEEIKKKILKHAENSEKASRIDAMLGLTRSQDDIPVIQKELDTDKWLINCQNGVIDLKTGELLPHDQKYVMTKLVPTVYDKEATCPRWLAFLDRIFAGKKSLIDYIQKVIGVCLTGEILPAVFIFHGTGANGKSTFLEVVRQLLSEYAQQADFKTFLQDKNQAIREDLASLCGARFVTASECDQGKFLSEAVVKQITGGDPIRARFLYANSFEFMPTFKIFLATNHRPNVIGADNGIWRRLKLVPFEVTIPEGERDPNLLCKLVEELPGILAWAVEGCLKWLSEGCQLLDPDEVLMATREYQRDNDMLVDFVEECCDVDSKEKVTAKDMYDKYIEFCGENGIARPLGSNEFKTKLIERGYAYRRSSVMTWFGIGLKPPAEVDEQDISNVEILVPDFVS